MVVLLIEYCARKWSDNFGNGFAENVRFDSPYKTDDWHKSLLSVGNQIIKELCLFLVQINALVFDNWGYSMYYITITDTKIT